jgi:mevalonate kinase
LQGATALAIPLLGFGGKWAYEADSTDRKKRQQRLPEMCDNQAIREAQLIDCEALQRDIAAGIFFDANIPTGYGLGSSGALCAAVYARYGIRPAADLSQAKKDLAILESFFHSSSSGIDPLTSWVAQPLLIEQKEKVRVANLKQWTNAPIVFLLDTHTPRQTGPLVQWFLAQRVVGPFADMLEKHYLPVHEELVRAWLQADDLGFWAAARQISALQFQYWTPMVAESMRHFWAQSLENQDFILKICGAGGGGFLLGFARDIDIAQRLKSQWPEIIFPLEMPVL